jgi:CheY-specific phosphatase CheX
MATAVDELGNIFTEELINVVAITSTFKLDVLSENHDNGFGELTSIMNLNSKKSGLVAVSAEEADIRAICSYMTGLGSDEVTRDDMEDTLCELANMTAGSAKLRITDPEYAFTISTPYVISGKNITLSTKKRINVISKIIGNGEISLKLKVVY